MSRAQVLFLSLFLSPALLCSLEASTPLSEEIADCPKEGCGEAPPPIEPTPCSKEGCGETAPMIEPASTSPTSTQPSPSQAAPVNNDVISEPPCGCSPHPQRVGVKHIESKGIGYNKGYTTFEAFFTVPSTLEHDWVPFIDVRAHVFNDGLPAVNAGLGLRYLGDGRVWGANLYYDYRKTHRLHYNQVGAGLETLGKRWDLRINGYFPVGKKVSHSFHSKFHQFKGHHLIIKSKKEFAMTGTNAEVGAHAYHRKNLDVYAAAGPYYFTGEGRSAWGGEGRLALTAYDCIRLQVNGSYDKIFKGIVQGEIGLFYSWGGKRAIKKRRCLDCCDSRMIVDRALQRVDRQEIVVVDRKHQKSKAINPTTGNPCTFWFVNNLSHSLGTFESPFNTLSAAQNASSPNDIIYVFPGNGTDAGMNTGIILKNGQQLLGAGINHDIKTTRGLITIPAQASGLPVISNAAAISPNLFAVTLKSGNNIVSGFQVKDSKGVNISGSIFSSGIAILGGSQYQIKNNILSTSNDGSCLSIYGGGVDTVISNNTFLGLDNGAGDTTGIYTFRQPSLQGFGGTITIKDNTFKGVNAASSLGESMDIFVNLSDPNSSLNFVISGNTINQAAGAFNGDALAITNSNGVSSSNLTATISDNQIVINNTVGIGVLMLEDAGCLVPFTVNVSSNSVQPSPPTTGYRFEDDTASSLLKVNFGSNVGTRVGPP